MSRIIRTQAVKFKNPDGSYSSADMMMNSPDVINKTEKKLLSYNGTNILNSNGTILTYDQIHAMLMDSPDFVVLVYQDRAYHPNLITAEQIVFISSYVTGGHTQMERISLSNEGLVTVTHGVSEMVSNKTGSITESNKADTDKYPSLKAVADYVDSMVSPLNADYADVLALLVAVRDALKNGDIDRAIDLLDTFIIGEEGGVLK